MQTRHEEIICKHEKWHAHGARRERCAGCGKTRTKWKRKRGRKPRKKRTARLKKTFEDKLTITQQASRVKTSVSALSARHRNILDVSRRQPWRMPLSEEGDLILVIDGNWYTFDEEKWTLYLMALRPVETDQAVFLPPVLLCGRECLRDWNQVLSIIPDDLRERVKALVSDGFRGSDSCAKEQGWIHQRCQFHLHAALLSRLGRNKAVTFREGRQQIYQSVCTFLDTTDPRILYKERDAIMRCSRNKQCPTSFRGKLKELLRREDEFRAWCQHPELRLPSTSNVVESMNAQLGNLERRCHGFKTPRALLNWATAHIRHHQTMKCTPKIPQN